MRQELNFIRESYPTRYFAFNWICTLHCFSSR